MLGIPRGRIAVSPLLLPGEGGDGRVDFSPRVLGGRGRVRTNDAGGKRRCPGSLPSAARRGRSREAPELRRRGSGMACGRRRPCGRPGMLSRQAYLRGRQRVPMFALTAC